MKITAIETYPIPLRSLLVRIVTDEGLEGWGEPIVEGQAEVVESAVAVMAEYLIGRSPMPVEDHWQHLRRSSYYRGGPVLSSALAGIDQALWDIRGRALGVSVASLLGGPTRSHVGTYAAIHGTAAEEIADAAREAVGLGYTALKFGPPGSLRYLESPAAIDRFVARAGAIRDAVGPEVDIALDLHGRASLPLAKRLLAELETIRLLFVEEPLRPEFVSEYGRLVDATPTPIAAGERLYSRWDFAPLLAAGVSVLQPDVSHAGGISEVRRIAAQAEVVDAVLAPHCPLGPVALAASLSIAGAAPNVLLQEQAVGVHDPGAIDFVTNPEVLALVHGGIRIPDGVGLGINVDLDAVRAAAREPHRWRTPTLRYDDGSFAEW